MQDAGRNALPRRRSRAGLGLAPLLLALSCTDRDDRELTPENRYRPNGLELVFRGLVNEGGSCETPPAPYDLPQLQRCLYSAAGELDLSPPEQRLSAGIGAMIWAQRWPGLPTVERSWWLGDAFTLCALSGGGWSGAQATLHVMLSDYMDTRSFTVIERRPGPDAAVSISWELPERMNAKMLPVVEQMIHETQGEVISLSVGDCVELHTPSFGLVEPVDPAP